jgi:hypothetical protein
MSLSAGMRAALRAAHIGKTRKLKISFFIVLFNTHSLSSGQSLTAQMTMATSIAKRSVAPAASIMIARAISIVVATLLLRIQYTENYPSIHTSAFYIYRIPLLGGMVDQRLIDRRSFCSRLYQFSCRENNLNFIVGFNTEILHQSWRKICNPPSIDMGTPVSGIRAQCQSGVRTDLCKFLE